MPTPETYVSRKRKLLAEIAEIASYTLEEFRDNLTFLASRICFVLERFDLGESVDDEASSFLESLEEGMKSDDLTALYKRFTSLMCNLYEVVGAAKDYSDEQIVR